MLKKWFALLLVFCFLSPLVASAVTVTKATFDITIDVHPESFEEDQRQVAQNLKDGLDLFAFIGDLDCTEDGFYILNGEMTTNGKNPVSLHMRSSNRFIEITSNLLGDEMLCLNMDAYLEFLMKPYNFLGLKTQYIGLITCLHATREPWGLFMNIVDSYCGGDETRHIETETLMALAQELNDFMESNRDMRYWLMAALMDIGLDSTISDFFYSLPEWIEECAGEDGLTIEVNGDIANWILGTSTIATVTHSEQIDSLVVTLSGWEGYAFKFANTITKDDQSFTVLFSSEEEGTILEIKAKAIGLPNRQKHTGTAQLSVSISGEYVAEPIDERASLDWTWNTDKEPEELKLALNWLNSHGLPKVTLDTYLTLADGDPYLFNYADWDVQGGTHLFSIYEETLHQLIDNIKKPLIENLLPVYLDLPISFIEVLTDWLAQSGLASAIMTGL